jgi:DNA-directed RNA polymerase specialized sigma24 family protein
MMSDVPNDQEARAPALKKLREARREIVEAASRRMKEQRQAVKAIKAQLQENDLTVPEIAALTGIPTSEVMWYVASLKKYGEILEGAKDGSYFRYHLAEPAAAEAGPVGPASNN